MAQLEAWEAEKKRYRLTDYGGGTFAYELKPETAEGELSHRICAACYQQGHKSILQYKDKSYARQHEYLRPALQNSVCVRASARAAALNREPRRTLGSLIITSRAFSLPLARLP